MPFLSSVFLQSWPGISLGHLDNPLNPTHGDLYMAYTDHLIVKIYDLGSHTNVESIRKNLLVRFCFFVPGSITSRPLRLLELKRCFTTRISLQILASLM